MNTVIERRREPARGGEVAPAAAGFRTDIQALRAVAVLAVVLNHLSASWLPGGYVGVDVFFVISGFLITAHLDREIVGTGRVRLGRFYARRIRRLLPAAFLVLACGVVAAYFLLPYSRWGATAHEAVASATYWENWLLAVQSVNYSAQDAAASLTQHYWSLSVEEQFYLVWPLLLLALFTIRRRAAQFTGLAVVGLASLVYGGFYLGQSPSQAYFVTQGRVWEFALGALVALLGGRLAMPRAVAGVASLAGFAMIIGAAAAYDHTTPFPGYLALVPTVGTALVIAAGQRPGRLWHTPVTAAWPVQFLGNVSYSLYLWHWPLIMLAPFALGDLLDAGRLTWPYQISLLLLAIGLAALSKVLLEDRFRKWPRLTRSTGLTFAGMIAGLAVVAVAAGTLNWTYDRHVTQAAREVAARKASPCHGAQARAPGSRCGDPFGPAQEVAMGPANEYWHLPPECARLGEFAVAGTQTTSRCDFSGGRRDADVVWLVGDSHAQQWQGPLLDLARERGWVLKIAVLGGCPFARIAFTGYGAESTEKDRQLCTDWRKRMTDLIAGDSPAEVFLTFYAREERGDDGSGRTQTEQYRDGLEPLWQRWTDAGAHVSVLADPPLNGTVRETDCVAVNPRDPRTCAVDRDVAQPPDPLAKVARSSPNPDVSLIDLTDYFCDDRRCYAVVGKVAVYYDINHMNLEFSRSLKPMIADALDHRR